MSAKSIVMVTTARSAGLCARRLNEAVNGWVAGVSNEVVRDTRQKLLLGISSSTAAG
jgi:hypothetical protein